MSSENAIVLLLALLHIAAAVFTFGLLTANWYGYFPKMGIKDARRHAITPTLVALFLPIGGLLSPLLCLLVTEGGKYGLKY